MKGLFSFWRELRRRNVHKGIISYVVFSWVLLQVISVLGSLVVLPIWLGKAVLISLLVFFPFWVAFSWLYDITPDGIKLTSRQNNPSPQRNERINKRLNSFILLFLVLAVMLLFIDRFRLTAQFENNEILATANPENSIAVLPFNDMSSMQDQAYFADGLSEELLNLLAQIQGLKVTSRTSCFSFKNSTLPATEIASQLGVKYLLEGSVRKDKDQVRITTQLIDATTDKNIWSQQFDRTLSNIFIIQGQVAQAVAQALQIELLENDLSISKTNPEVYNLYLQAVAEFEKGGDEDILRSEALLRKAIAQDSTYIPAQLLLAENLQSQANYGIVNVNDGSIKAIAIVDNILKKYPNHALALASRADMALAYEWDFNKAQQGINKALAIAPNDPVVISYAATLETSLGNLDKAIAFYEYTARLDPLNPGVYSGLGIALNAADRLDEAEKAIHKTIELQESNWASYYTLSRILARNNKIEAALDVLKKEDYDGWIFMARAIIYHDLGDAPKANMNLEKLIDSNGDTMAYQVAQVYALRNEPDLAFEWLDKAYEQHDMGLNEMLSEPDFRPIHKDPRWDSFIKKVEFFR